MRLIVRLAILTCFLAVVYPSGAQMIPGVHLPSKKSKTPDAPDFFADGEITKVSGSQLVVGTDDGRVLTLKVTGQTIWQLEGKASTVNDMKPEMVVHIEAAEDGESNLTAMTII